MLQSAWLFIGGLAVLTSAAAMLTQDDGQAIVVGVLGFISWGVFAYGSLDVRVVGDSVTYSFGEPAITVLAVAFSLLPAYVALTGPTELVGRARDADPQDL